MDDWRAIAAEHDIPPRFLRMQFPTHDATRDRWPAIQAWVKEPKGNVFMTGACGNGKTCCAVATFAYWTHLKGRGARFFNAEGLYAVWRGDAATGQIKGLLDRLADAPLLILDDLGQGEIADGYKRWLYALINKRWEWERPTVVTTNLNSKDFNEILGDAMLSRLMDGQVWTFKGSDSRIQKTKRL